MKTLKRERLIRPYRVTRGEGFRLKDFDPGDAQGLDLKAESDKFLSRSVRHLSDLQEKLYAQNHWALLLIFQGMDAGGKDGAIRHVMSGVNPQGCRVCSFQAPSAEELEHDFLWRASRCLPKRGQIGIFNRSYYEEALVVRVHPELLQAEKIPSSLVGENIWKERFEDINAFERFLTRNGTVICKFFLNLSKEEQRARFLSRLDEPDKNWKFSADDVRDRDRWGDYMHAYEDMIVHTATEYAPWYVIPADHKWFARMAISSAILETLEELKLTYPRIDGARRKQLREARRLLEREKPTRF
jgi:PPK2 family polyphosphate:nucleotide phosphotransferase